jgi:hypothetical protein
MIAELFDVFYSGCRPPEPMGDIIPRLSGSLVTYDAVDLINHNPGYPPPFRKSSRDGDDHVSDRIIRINYAVYYCESRVLLRVQQYL